MIIVAEYEQVGEMVVSMRGMRSVARYQPQTLRRSLTCLRRTGSDAERPLVGGAHDEKPLEDLKGGLSGWLAYRRRQTPATDKCADSVLTSRS